MSLCCLCIGIAFVLTCCAHGPMGVYHVVKKDETLWSIADTYETDMAYLSRINNIDTPDAIKEGQVIFIPHATAVRNVVVKKTPLPPSVPPSPEHVSKTDSPSPVPMPETRQEKTAPPADEKDTPKNNRDWKPAQADSLRFAWPITGAVSSHFGKQNDTMRLGDGTTVKTVRYNNGIKIDAPAGTAVSAAESGIVDRCWPVKFYGNTVIINHGNGYMTVYAHLRDSLVKQGQVVKKGEKIAVVGQEEKTGKSCLHFEIRYHNRAKDPLRYLPTRN